MNNTKLEKLPKVLLKIKNKPKEIKGKKQVDAKAEITDLQT